ncbi:MAG: GerMN domain-containing protein [Candidatus Sericytochromatia bacterium]|nr:GerMN domain-containing protein [Candidatus Sericytochromatia bacterium]
MRVRTLVVVLAGSLGLAGLVWYGFSATADRSVRLYQADAQGMALIPTSRTLRLPAGREDWARAVFHSLKTFDGAGVSPIPSGVDLLAVRYNEPQWDVQLRVAAPLGSTAERLLLGAVVRTLLENTPGASRVQIALQNAQGQPYASQHVDLTAPLTLADVANQLPAHAAPGPIKGQFWWPNPAGDSLIPVQTDLLSETGTAPRDALAQLLRGPGREASAFLAPLRSRAEDLRWGSLRDGTVQLECGESFSGPTLRTIEVRAVVLTLTEFPDVQRVAFTRNQSPVGGKAGPYDLSRPLTRADVQDAPGAPAASP